MPPEDCGGSLGYAELLEIVANPDQPEYDDRLEWLGGDFDPECFDLAEVNRKLMRSKRFGRILVCRNRLPSKPLYMLTARRGMRGCYIRPLDFQPRSF
jgi:Plasmid pRiA4b ORF-3-like protein